MFTVFYNTGGRVSEITGLKVADVILDGCAAVRIRGKGRKERSVPLWRTTVTEVRRWLARTHAGPDQPLFPGWSGTRERALNAVQPPHTKHTRYQPTDRVLHFLETL